MFAGRGEQSLVLTLTADFRKVRHILFGSGYGAKVNIFKWINYPLLWVESRILILFWFFSFSITFTEYPPLSGKSKFPSFSLSPNPKLQNTPPSGKSKFPSFSLSPNPKLQNTPPWKIQISKFFPKSKSEVAEYPPLWKIQISKFFPKSKSEVAEYPPPLENPNFQVFP